MKMRHILISILLSVTSIAYGKSPTNVASTPEAVAEEYLKAWQTQNWGDIYDMLDPITREKYESEWEKNKSDMLQLLNGSNSDSVKQHLNDEMGMSHKDLPTTVFRDVFITGAKHVKLAEEYGDLSAIALGKMFDIEDTNKIAFTIKYKPGTSDEFSEEYHLVKIDDTWWMDGTKIMK